VLLREGGACREREREGQNGTAKIDHLRLSFSGIAHLIAHPCVARVAL
jgi:hypothetical protein